MQQKFECAFIKFMFKFLIFVQNLMCNINSVQKLGILTVLILTFELVNFFIFLTKVEKLSPVHIHT
jgi:hypothetical protein